MDSRRCLIILSMMATMSASESSTRSSTSFFFNDAATTEIDTLSLHDALPILLFGPVSISNSYAPVSRRLMVEYLRTNNSETELARHVKPRHPFRAQRSTAWDE